MDFIDSVILAISLQDVYQNTKARAKMKQASVDATICKSLEISLLLM